MKIGSAEKWIREALMKIYPDGESATISDWVLEALTGYSQTQRLQKKEETLSTLQERELERMILRLKKQEPVQYILQTSWFYGMKLHVDRGVLIPRPETEELVEWIVRDVSASGKEVFGRRPGEADETRLLKILDVGTGSGCIALALKKEMPRAEVWGCDISESALNVARRNGADLDIRVDFQGLDFLDPDRRKGLPTVDILVSNPPYVPLRDKDSMQPNVLQYEPHTALFVPDENPLVFYKAILDFAHHRLYPEGRIYLEVHENLAEEVRQLFEKEKSWDVTGKKDMQGKDRMVRAVRIEN